MVLANPKYTDSEAGKERGLQVWRRHNVSGNVWCCKPELFTPVAGQLYLVVWWLIWWLASHLQCTGNNSGNKKGSTKQPLCSTWNSSKYNKKACLQHHLQAPKPHQKARPRVHAHALSYVQTHKSLLTLEAAHFVFNTLNTIPICPHPFISTPPTQPQPIQFSLTP
jgi:hypothetical protein